MLRLVGFFALVLLAYQVLSVLPIFGPILARLGIFGIWAVAILLSVLSSKLGAALVVRARLRRRIRELGLVETPNNQGKLGVLLLQAGRTRAAVPHLEAAFRGQPGVSDWPFALGRAKLALGDPEAAGSYFARVVADEPSHGYGDAYIGLARAALALGRPAGALDALDEHDRRFGKNPVGLFQRGQALKALGQRPEARAAFDELLGMQSELPSYQRKGYFALALRAMLARWV